RDPDLSRRQDGKAAGEVRRCTLSRDRMDDVADGRPRPDARPGAPLREIQQRQGALRRRALPEGRSSSLQGARYAARRPRVRADQYSIADIAIWPWISRFEWQTID